MPTIAAPRNLVLAPTADSGVSNDKLTNIVLPTVTGLATAGSLVTLYDGQVVVGTAVAAGNGAWSIKAVTVLSEGRHALSATATVGNDVSVNSAELAITIDVTPPAPLVAPQLIAGEDTGINGDYITNKTTPVFAGKLTAAEVGYTVTLYDGATVVGSAKVMDDSYVWSITTDVLAEGMHALTVTLTDLAGNVSLPSAVQQLQILTQTAPQAMPELLPAFDTGSSNSDRITNANLVSIGGTSVANATLKVFDGTREVIDVVADAQGNWRLDNLFLSNGQHSITVVRQADFAGNIARSEALLITVDNTAPRASSAPLLDPLSDTGYADDALTSDATPTVSGKAEAGATVTLYDGNTKVGSTVADADGNWRITSDQLADGDHNLNVKVSDVAGNVSAASPDLFISIDTEAPQPDAPQLAPESDTGYGNDGVTMLATPRVTGVTESGALVTLYDGGVKVGEASADVFGKWSIDTSQLTDDKHSLTVRVTDAAGNISAPSAALNITVDTKAPQAPAAPDLLDSSDSGISDQDDITNATRPELGGKAEAGASIAIYDGATLLGSTLADDAGNWTFQPAQALADGVHSFTVKATDVAGNVSAASAALAVTIDSTPAVAPTDLALAAASDSGVSASDRITKDSTPTITGKAVANATVKLYEGEILLGEAKADASGNWSIVASALGDGLHRLTAQTSALTGTVSAPSDALQITIDTDAPAAPAVPLLEPLSDSGSANSDGITNRTPELHGSAEAGATVSLYAGVELVGSTVAGADGSWTIKPAQQLADGPHSLSVTATDVAGNVSLPSPALQITIDTKAPAAPAAPDLLESSDSGTSGSDNITAVTRPELAGKTEVGASVAVYDGTTLLGSTMADKDGNWTFQPARPLNDGEHVFTIRATDVAGNVSEPSAALTVIIDARPLAVPTALALSAASDSGVSDRDGVTSDTTPTITGKADADALVRLYDGSTLLGEARADASGNWSITASQLADGLHQLTASTSSLTGTVSQPSAPLAVTIDSQPPVVSAPVLDPLDDSGVSNSDGITNVAQPRLSGTAEVGATVVLYDDGQQLASTVADADGSWHFAQTLADGKHSLTVRASDAAGNLSAHTAALELTVLAAPLIAPGAPELLAGSDSGLSDSDNITNVATPVIVGTAAAGLGVALYDGATLIGTALADASGQWRIALSKPLSDAVHQLTATASDVAGNVSPASAALRLTVDTTPPTASGLPDLAADSDKGVSSSDNLTNVATPMIGGKAEAGSTITLYDDGVQVASVRADQDGNWKLAGHTLTESSHRLTATVTDVAGNVSPLSEALVLTIDLTPPPAPAAPLLDAASDSGLSSSDGITRITTPHLTGTAEAGASVLVFDGALQIGSATTDDSGNWSFTPTAALGEGAHSLTVKAADAAGNVSLASAALLLTIDTKAPNAPSAPDLADGSDLGSSKTDNITSVTRPLVTGTAEVGATVALYDGNVLLGSAVADGSGAWQITPAQDLANGAHVLTAKATDAAGNVSPASPSLTVTINATPPLSPSALDLTTDSGRSTTDNITNITAPTITGKAAAGASVTLLDGTVVLGTVTANASGVWTLAPKLADGEHHLTAISTNLQTGAVSAPSAELLVTIDSQLPELGPLVLDASSDSGLSNSDLVTKVNKPTITGTAEVNALVTLYDGSTVLGTALADANGAWSITSSVALANGARLLTAKAADVAGNLSTATLTVTVDTTPPATPAVPDLVAEHDSGTSTTDNVTNVTQPVIGGKSEGKATMALYDGTVLIGTTQADDAGNWQIKLAQSLSQGVHKLTVTATDLAGNTSVSSAALSLTIDTDAPLAPTALDLLATSDSGASTSDDLTKVTTPTITGSAEAGTVIRLYEGDKLVATSSVVTPASGVWSVTITAANALAHGVHQLTATATDLAGNVSALSPALTINVDTEAPLLASAPVLDPLSDTGISQTDNLTNDTTPTLSFMTEANATVALYVNGQLLTSTKADANGLWTYTMAALASNTTYNLSVTVTDLAGNVSKQSPALALVLDTALPATPAAPDLLAASDSGPSTTDNITNVVLPTFVGKAELNATVTLYEGTVVIGSARVDSTGAWQIVPSAPLSEAKHALTVKVMDAAGNVSAASPVLNVTIDTTAPNAPATLALASGSDSGSSTTDRLTNIKTPTITGTAEAGTVINLYEGVTLLGKYTATGGAWTITTGTLTDGVHQLQATATDTAGNVSVLSEALEVNIDTAAPAVTAPVLAALSDSGRSNSDNITNVQTPTVSGTAEKGASVALYDGAKLLATTTADDNGGWSFTTATLSASAHSLTVKATDAAGNVATSAALVLTVDIAAPATPAAPTLLASDDVGSSKTDRITSVSKPTLSGAGEANALISLYDDGKLLTTVLADTSGNWKTTLSEALADGKHNLTVTATDIAGNVSIASAALALTIDASAPDAPSAPDLVATSDSGASSSDNLTNKTTFAVTGTAEAGSTVTLYEGNTVIGSGIATNGVWSFTTTTALTHGEHHLVARGTDVAGNVSAASAELVVNIDTIAPTALAPVLDAASDSGRSSADRITNDTTPTVGGVTEAGATVAVYEGTTLLGSTLADDQGVWSFTTGVLSATAHTLTVRVTDTAGNVSTASASTVITIDTAAPALPTALDLVEASDSGSVKTDNITNVVLPTISGTSEKDAFITLYEGTTVVGTGTAVGTAWQITLTQPLSEGLHTLTATATDIAGNTSAMSTSALKITIDTSKPLAPAALDLADALDTGISNSDNLTNKNLLSFTGKADAGAVITLYDNNVKLSSVTASAAGVWTYTPASTATLADGEHHLTITATDLAGNVSDPSEALVVTVDTKAPLVVAPVLDPLSDSGVSGDKITSDTTPTLTGKVEPGNQVAVFDGTVKLGDAVVADDGSWSFTTGVLSAGAHTLTIKATDAAGNTSTSSPALALVLDTSIAQPALPDLDAGSDSGQSSTDNVTNVTSPLIKGTTEAGATVVLYDGGKAICETVANNTGAWQIKLNDLSQDIHLLTVRVTDVAGNVSQESASMQLTIDATADLAGKPDLAAASDSGASQTDDITNVTAPVVTGKAAFGSKVAIYDKGVLLTTVTADATDTWTLSGKTLAAGLHTLTVRITDLAGNVSADSEALNLTIDTSAATPGAPDLTDASDSGNEGMSNYNTDNYTNVSKPVFTGKAEAGATVNLYKGTTLMGTGVADSSGVWTITTTVALTEGSNSLTAKIVDLAGNVSAASGALTVTLDTTAPGALTDTNTAANFANVGGAAGALVGVTANAVGTVAGGYSLSANPEGLFSIDARTGVLSLAAGAVVTGGAHQVTVRAVDQAGNATLGNFTILGNTAPTISAIANTTFAEDTKSSPLAFTVADAESLDGMTFSATSSNGMVSGFKFEGTGANRTLTLTPSANAYGTTTITVTVKDAGGLTSTTSFQANITPVDDPSQVGNDIVMGSESAGAKANTSTSTLLLNDSDPDSTIWITSVRGISGGSVSLSGSNVAFTTASGAHGLGHYSYTLNDGNVGDVWVKLAPVSDNDLTYEIQRMYLGYFGRPADKDGLAGKVAIARTELASGKALVDVMKMLGDHFVNSPEYKATWGGLTDDAIIAKIYNNLFGRHGDYDQSEITFWSGPLSRGELSYSTIVNDIANGAHNEDIGATANRTYAAQYFTDQMTAAQNAAYVGDAASAQARAYLDYINERDDSLASAASMVNYYINLMVNAGRSGGIADTLASNASLLADSGVADLLVIHEQAGDLNVLNFSSADGDQLVFAHQFNGLTLSSAAEVLARSHVEGASTVIDLGEGHAIVIVGVTALTVHDISLAG
ncbi:MULTISPECIES: Ig-like domain-containing protein [unclassified Duganella]|uniref:Ig-like domain-containing protein n=1 Tax=unclassified Duganella TaxID=2636909 RepID=UPI000889D086|nr:MULTISPECIES: Ig-like domain-containing protein [unclassified Duganella]SDH13643.1 Ig-like domain (group 3) [Duganella sp. OV458]SDK28240.1 Ig-like domain (group 3) [Duganella sp. OV510]